MVGSLGLVTITAGTPIRATANQAAPTQRLGAKSIRVQVWPSNAGIIYVGIQEEQGSPIGDGLIAVLPKPTSATTGPFDSVEITLPDLPAGLDASKIWIDGTSSGDSVIVSYTAN